MGILNRVINILILLAAIAAVVFSYMLFSKRNELTDGWQKMAAAINATAATLDDKSASGTKAAQELAPTSSDIPSMRIWIRYCRN